jgi:Caspase domain
MAGRRSALIVANSVYADPKLPDLIGPTVDADELGRVLSDPSIGNFQLDMHLNARVQTLRRRLEIFFTSSRARDDFLLLHISGHGIKDDAGRLYFAAADTELEHMYSTAIEAGWLRQLIDDSRSERILLLLDCCFGGAFASKFARRAPGAEQVGIKERFDGRGTVVLTASTAMQYAFEAGRLDGTAEPSIFTNALVTGLTDGAADRNLDGVISVDELYDFAAEFVEARHPHQTPTKSGYVEGDLVVAHAPAGRVVRPKPLPDDLRAAIVSPDTLTRLAAVRELSRLLESWDDSITDAAIAALRKLEEDDSKAVSAEARERYQALVDSPPEYPDAPSPPSSPANQEPGTAVLIESIDAERRSSP